MTATVVDAGDGLPLTVPALVAARAAVRGVLPPERRPAPGERANLFGMTETFGPYCGARLDLDLPEGERGSCGQPFDGVDVRI